MNKIINKFLMTRDKFMPELHLKQPGFTYGACGQFTKRRERIQNFRETVSLKHLDKACFDHDAAYSDSKDLGERSISDKILRDRAYEVDRNYGYDGYQRAVASMVCKFFDKVGSKCMGIGNKCK